MAEQSRLSPCELRAYRRARGDRVAVQRILGVTCHAAGLTTLYLLASDGARRDSLETLLWAVAAYLFVGQGWLYLGRAHWERLVARLRDEWERAPRGAGAVEDARELRS